MLIFEDKWLYIFKWRYLMIYWSWSYKKKVIWNAVQLPVILLLVIWLLSIERSTPTVILSLAAASAAVITLVHTYSKWHQEVS